jgi:hypothetical protein
MIMETFLAHLQYLLDKRSKFNVGKHGCTLWLGSVTKQGYGRQKVYWPKIDTPKVERAHKLAYMIKKQIIAH